MLVKCCEWNSSCKCLGILQKQGSPSPRLTWTRKNSQWLEECSLPTPYLAGSILVGEPEAVKKKVIIHFHVWIRWLCRTNSSTVIVSWGCAMEIIHREARLRLFHGNSVIRNNSLTFVTFISYRSKTVPSK